MGGWSCWFVSIYDGIGEKFCDRAFLGWLTKEGFYLFLDEELAIWNHQYFMLDVFFLIVSEVIVVCDLRKVNIGFWVAGKDGILGETFWWF